MATKTDLAVASATDRAAGEIAGFLDAQNRHLLDLQLEINRLAAMIETSKVRSSLIQDRYLTEHEYPGRTADVREAQLKMDLARDPDWTQLQADMRADDHLLRLKRAEFDASERAFKINLALLRTVGEH